MKHTSFVGILTGVGFLLAAWSYPIVSPVMNKVLNPTYKCRVEYLLPEKIPQERSTEVLRSDLQVGHYINGFKIVQLHHFENEVLASAYHPVYSEITIICKEA